MTDSPAVPQDPQDPRRGSRPRVVSETDRAQRSSPSLDRPEHVDLEIEQAVGITVDNLAAIFVLSAVKGFGPQKFRELQLEGLRPIDIVSGGKPLPTKGKRGDSLRSQLLFDIDKQRPICRERAIRQILAAKKNRAAILTYEHADYPANVLNSSNPVPLLYPALTWLFTDISISPSQEFLDGHLAAGVSEPKVRSWSMQREVPACDGKTSHRVETRTRSMS